MIEDDHFDITAAVCVGTYGLTCTLTTSERVDNERVP